ncbi:hypothetical protein MNBD_PLANCTO02-2778 [hydrothermal vent metagenome]|uniref:histidine kinase n=1 Tax=hydrothermal vent metagenome TaxID=652676 RepID=A0A3B1DJM5_9ZZZZ
MKRLSIRWKLTLWSSLTLSLLILGFGSVVYVMMVDYLRDRTSFELEEEFGELKRAVKHAQNYDELQTVLTREFADHASFDFEVRSADEQVIFRSERLQKLKSDSKNKPHFKVPVGEESEVSIHGLGDFIVGCEKVASPVGELTLSIAIPLAPHQKELTEFLYIILSAGTVTIICAVAGGYVLARRVLLPVQRITQLAQHITADNLNERLPVFVEDDELGELTNTLNEMIERLETAFEEVQQFSGDAAHELRTPLTIMRSRVEVALRTERTLEEYQNVLEDVLDETMRLSKLIEQLLFLLREDNHANAIISVGDIVKDVVTHIGDMSDKKNISVELGELGDWHVEGNSLLLSQAYFNILENAVKYTPSSGTIKIEGYIEYQSVHICIADNGPGIPEQDIPNIFRRLYRADESRCRESGGTGLGLAIARRIIELHHGKITLENQPSSGAAFNISVPLVPKKRINT